MWLISTVVLLSIVCLGESEESCPEHLFLACSPPVSGFPLKFPKTEDEYQTLCLNVKQFSECAISHLEKCPSTAGLTATFVSSLLEVSDSFCKSDSVWYTGAIKYGSCFDRFINYGYSYVGKCPNEITDKIDHLFSTMDKPFRCYWDIRTTTCIIEQMTSQCGRMAKELALHFVSRLGFSNIICLDDQEELTTLIRDLNVTNLEPETSEEEFETLFENVAASYGSNKDKCLSNYKNLCPEPVDFIHDIPENHADLTAKCSKHKEYLDCLIDYQETCEEKIWDMEFFQSDLLTLDMLCNESSVLFNELAKNGQCYNRMYDTEAREHMSKCEEEIRKKEKYNETFYQTDDNVIHCFWETQQIACVAEEVESECGKNAKELMLHAAQMSKMRYSRCQHFLTEMDYFATQLELNFEPEQSLSDFINTLENEAGDNGI